MAPPFVLSLVVVSELSNDSAGFSIVSSFLFLPLFLLGASVHSAMPNCTHRLQGRSSPQHAWAFWQFIHACFTCFLFLLAPLDLVARDVVCIAVVCTCAFAKNSQLLCFCVFLLHSDIYGKMAYRKSSSNVNHIYSTLNVYWLFPWSPGFAKLWNKSNTLSNKHQSIVQKQIW